jgi:hypothetical protein
VDIARGGATWGTANCLMLRKHARLAVGKTVADALALLHKLDRLDPRYKT